MTLYVLRHAASGEYWNSGAPYGYKGRWSTDVAKAKFITTLGQARSQRSRLGGLGVPVEIVALEAVVKGVIE